MFILFLVLLVYYCYYSDLIWNLDTIGQIRLAASNRHFISFNGQVDQIQFHLNDTNDVCPPTIFHFFQNPFVYVCVCVLVGVHAIAMAHDP